MAQWGLCHGKENTGTTDMQKYRNTLVISFSNTNYKIVVTSRSLGAVAVTGISIVSVSQFDMSNREGSRGSQYWYEGYSYYIAIGY